MRGRWTYFKFRIGIVLIVLFIFGAVLICEGIRDTSTLSKDVPDMNEMLSDDFKKNMFVQGQVWYCEGNFAYEYEESDYSDDEEVLREFYFIPLQAEWDKDNYKYIVISASDQVQIDSLSRLEDQTYDYFYNDVPSDEIDWEDIYFVGQVKPLEDDTTDLLYEYMQKYGYLETGSREEFNSMVVPYEIQYKTPSSVHSSLFAGVVIIAIPIIVGAILVGVYMRKKRMNSGLYPQAENYTYINNQPNSFNQNQSFGESSFTQQNPYQQPNQSMPNPYMQQNPYSQQTPPAYNPGYQQQMNVPPVNGSPNQQQYNMPQNSPYQQPFSAQPSNNNTVQTPPDNKPPEMEELNTDNIDTSNMKF
jgi:hypothetical protein